MMRHTGGPRPEADVRAAYMRRLNLMEKGEARMYKIVAEESDEVLGTIGIWKISMQNQGEFDNTGFAGVLRCNDWRIDFY
jgi:hypothetical protein